MAIKVGKWEFIWMTVGAVFFLILAFIVVYFQSQLPNPARQLAFKATRLELVSQMRLKLTTASEAEKSAVMAVTDKDSRIFANESRSATVEAELARKKLEYLLESGGKPGEKEMLSRFTKSFMDFKNIDEILLDLAVKNTNLKAFSLAFGPAVDTLQKMDTGLSALLEKSAGTLNAGKVSALVFGAQVESLRIQAMLAPHIAEDSDRKMYELEKLMTIEDQKVRENLSGLSGLPQLNGDPDLKLAVMEYDRYSGIRKRILALSRENTNIRSLAMSLSRKREIFLICQYELSALQNAILNEPVRGLNYEPYNPRSMQYGK